MHHEVEGDGTVQKKLIVGICERTFKIAIEKARMAFILERHKSDELDLTELNV
jgi:hypothetical protein